MQGRCPFTGLDPWPEKRPSMIVIEHTREHTYAVAYPGGQRLLMMPRVWDVIDHEYSTATQKR